MTASLSHPAAWWPQLRAGVQRQRRAFDARARRERMLLMAVVAHGAPACGSSGSLLVGVPALAGLSFALFEFFAVNRLTAPKVLNASAAADDGPNLNCALRFQARHTNAP